MKRVFLIMLACAFVYNSVTAQTNKDEQPAASQQAEAQSPELIEAQRLSIEVVKLHKAGKFDEATTLAKRALQLREKALAPGHDLIQSSLINLGELYRARRKYGEAKTYFERLLAIYEQSPGPAIAAVARVLDVLAYLNYMELDFDKSEKLYKRALALREQGSGPKNLEVATSLFNLAEFYRLRGEYTKAEPFYKKAIEIKGSTLGPDNKEVEVALERFSCLYYSMDQREKLKTIRSQFSFLREEDADKVDKGEVLNGKAISLPRPKYPTAAMRYRLTGTVVIKVNIDEAGKVIGAEDMCAAHPLLLGAAKEAAYQARFTPTLLSGVPVSVSGIITYRFVAK
jgi:TonB family protein